jgi:rod shape determining protein RodA
MRRFLSLRDFDWTLFAFVMSLSIMSVFEIYSATLHTKFHGFEKLQVLWICAGLVAMFLMSVLDYHKLLNAIYWIYGFCLLSLVAVLAVGTRVMGGKRWIRLPGGMHFQPSEWVKLVLIVLMARYFTNMVGRELTWRDIFKAIVFVAVPMLLVLRQPDMGTALTYAPTLLLGLFLGGVSWRKGGLLVLVGVLSVAGIWTSGHFLKPYQKARLTAFMNPGSDPRGSGYQILQSKIAVGDGGVFGRGSTHGTQTQGDFLPIPYTDFIFAAFSEEHGFVGAVLVLLIYFLILMRLIQNAQTAADLPGSFLVMGVAAVLTFEIAVNVGMVLGLMPVTGIPLPLMSYGGSSVLFTFLALGMVMNVRMSRFVNK